MNPKISVVMPVYNTKAEYLKEAVNSILNQTLADFELLIINDASTKNETLDILNSIRDSRVKIFTFESNQERVKARNFGLEHARGEYIAFMDDDDVSYSSRLEEEFNYLNAHPEVDCLGTWCDIIGEDRESFGQYVHLKGSQQIELYLMFKACYFPTSTVLIRRNKLEQFNIRFRDECLLSEDYDFWLQMIGKLKFDTLEEILGAYRFHFGNTTHGKLSIQVVQNFKCRFDFFKNYFNCVNNHELLFKSLDTGKVNNFDDFIKLHEGLLIIIKFLEEKGYSKQNINKVLRINIRNLYYHIHDFKSQLTLFNSPLTKYFNLPLPWRLFCLITRGVL